MPLSPIDAPGPSPWDAAQHAWIAEALGPVAVVEDLSWDLQGLLVTRVRADSGDWVVKTGRTGWTAPRLTGKPEPLTQAAAHPHMVREIRAYEKWVDPLAGYAPRLHAADSSLGILAIEHLTGELVQGSPAAGEPEVWAEAGRATAQFNRTVRAVNSSFDGGNLAKLRHQLEAWHRGTLYEPATDAAASRLEALARAAESALSAWEPQPLSLVATHADNSPRNWFLTESGGFRLIDFGRAGIRPGYVELDHIQGAPAELRDAFTEGWGRSWDALTWEPGERQSYALYAAASLFASLEWARAHGEADFEQVILDRDSWVLPLLAAG